MIILQGLLLLYVMQLIPMFLFGLFIYHQPLGMVTKVSLLWPYYVYKVLIRGKGFDE